MPLLRYNPQFLLSALDAAQFPAPTVPEIAFLGRSNVGKSSLLNSLVGEKAAKVSQTPGRTRAINFFALLDQRQQPKSIFADLPGLRLCENLEINFGGMAEVHRPLSCGTRDAEALHLPRGLQHPSSAERREARRLAAHAGREFLVVATKIDRLSGNARTRNLLAIKTALDLSEVLPVSAKTGAGVKELWNRIEAAGS